MLLCSSKIPVKETCTDDILVQMATEWVQSSRNYSFDSFAWDHSGEFLQKGHNGEIFQVGKFNNGQICAVHFSSVDNRAIHWCSDFILDSSDNILAFQLYRDASAEVDFVPPMFSLPQLVTSLIQSGYCANDNDLPVDNKPFYVTEDEANWVADLMLHKTEYSLPVVYVSCVQDGHAVVNPYMLADKLKGVAHVVFETSRALSLKLRELTNGDNPYTGALEIYYPNGSQRILPSWLNGPHHKQVRTIVNEIFQHLVQLRVEDKFSWSQLQSAKLKGQLKLITEQKEADGKTYGELERTYEEILSEKDQTIQQLTDQLKSSNTIITQLEQQLSRVKDVPVLVQGAENDLYPNEQRSILNDFLRADLSRLQENSRRYHVLKSILDANVCPDSVGEKREELKRCLQGYSKFTPAIRKALEDMGFTVSDNGKHVKAVFCDDQRYMGTLSKTGSDHRGAENIIHDMIRKIF